VCRYGYEDFGAIHRIACGMISFNVKLTDEAAHAFSHDRISGKSGAAYHRCVYGYLYPVGFPTLRRTIQKIGKPWGKKGETPVVMTTGARYALSLISAITSKRPARRR
jgi:hypothetical protein